MLLTNVSEQEELKTQIHAALVVSGHALTLRASRIKQHWEDIEELVAAIRKQLQEAQEELARIALMAVALQREQEIQGEGADLNITEQDRERIRMGREIAWRALESSLESILNRVSEGKADPSQALEQIRIMVETIVQQTLESIA